MVGDLALLNGWQPDIIGDLELAELVFWHQRALDADRRQTLRRGL